MVLQFLGTTALQPTGRDEEILRSVEAHTSSVEESDADEPTEYENPQTGERFSLRCDTPSAGAKASRKGKSKRILGGKAAVPKKIVANYDSDDARIMELKDLGYSDEYVAAKLAQEDRVRYDPKSVGSRWYRIKKLVKQQEEQRLDDEMSDWHMDEDKSLAEVVHLLDEKYEEEKKKLELRKWREVSDVLALRMPKKKYSGKACHERYVGLQDGTAEDPIELDPDQAARRMKTQQRIAANRQRRAVEDAEEQRRAEKELAKKAAKKAERERLHVDKIKREKHMAMLKEEARRTKQQRKEEREAARLAKRTAMDLEKLENKWRRDLAKEERRIYQVLTGKPMRGQRRVKFAGINDGSSEEEVASFADSEEDASSDSESDQSVASIATDFTFASKKSTASRKKVKLATKPKITKETLLDPRSILTRDELGALLKKRKMAAAPPQETHAHIVARIVANDEDLAAHEIDGLLDQLFGRKKGAKREKLARLAQLEAEESQAGRDGVRSTDRDFKEGYEGYQGEFAGLL